MARNEGTHQTTRVIFTYVVKRAEPTEESRAVRNNWQIHLENAIIALQQKP
jgi:hypothetical protein